MDINYYKQYEPIDGKWYITKELGRGAYGYVFEVERHDYSDMKSAMKIISVPYDSAEYIGFKNENFSMSDSEVKKYYESIVKEYIKEFQLLSKLKGNSNIVSYEDHDVKPKKGFFGWDIFIRMELLTPMPEYFKQHYTREQVIKLGIDICKALEICNKYQIIHRDIKPTNIFVSNTGDFKLGDFGIARIKEKTSAGMSTKGTYTYMAPEVCHGGKYSISADIYSLGIVMYKLLNNNMEPFRTASDYENAQKALEMRLSGMPLSAPANADARLSEIILKACEFDQDRRYQDPAELRKSLEALITGTYRTESYYIKNSAVKGRVALSKNSDIDNSDYSISGISNNVGFDEKKSIVKTVLYAVISGLICLGIVVCGGYFYYGKTYNSALKNLRNENYEEARELFGEIKWYKNSAELILNCDYLQGEKYVENFEFEKALTIFNRLSKVDYLDSKDKCDECLIENAKWNIENDDFQTALQLLDKVSGKRQGESEEIAKNLRHNVALDLYERKMYSDAKKIFEDLDDKNMVDECEYRIALKYKNDGNYSRAMSVFYKIINYNDSKDQFALVERMLTNENKENGKFSLYKNIVGRYSNEDGVYVEYKADSEGYTQTAYNMKHDDSELFKIEYGIHYHQTEEGFWKKQWIFEKVSENEFDVYNYLDNKVYTLELQN